MYKSHSPLTLWADACVADDKDSYDFRFAMDELLAHGSIEAHQQLSTTLLRWRENHEALASLKEDAPLAMPAFEPLPNSIKRRCNEEALVFFEGEATDYQWLESAKSTLEQAKTQSGRTSLDRFKKSKDWSID